jgi:hypothetical protein
MKRDLSTGRSSPSWRKHPGPMTLFHGGACLLLLACSPPGTEVTNDSVAGGVDPASAEVIAATEGLLTALADRDTAALRARIDPTARFFAVPADAAEVEIRVFDLEEFLGVVAESPEPLVERIWDPTVHVDGPVASLWAPYDFHVGDRFSHCGHAAFQYVLRDGMWRLVSETYTVRVNTCPASPEDP